jgi:hypothetical protein
MDQPAHHSLLGEALEVLARLAETRADHEDGPYPELAVHEVVERNAGGRDVPSGLGRRELDAEAVALGVLDAVEERPPRPR